MFRSITRLTNARMPMATISSSSEKPLSDDDG